MNYSTAKLIECNACNYFENFETLQYNNFPVYVRTKFKTLILWNRRGISKPDVWSIFERFWSIILTKVTQCDNLHRMEYVTSVDFGIWSNYYNAEKVKTCTYYFYLKFCFADCFKVKSALSLCDFVTLSL